MALAFLCTGPLGAAGPTRRLVRTDAPPKATGAWEAFQWRHKTWVNENGEVPPGALRRAIEDRRRNLDHLAARGIAGRAGIGPGTWTNRGPQNVGGRTRSLLIDPRNPNAMLAGAVSGGLFRTSDGGQTWQVVNDFLPTLAIGSLARDPHSPDVIYAGTGEGQFNFDAVNGAGIFKSTDNGQTWNLLPGTSDWSSVNRISIHPSSSGILLASLRYGGIERTTDGGQTWKNVRGGQGSYDVEFDPTDGTKAVGHILDYDFSINNWFHLVVYTRDAGATWFDAAPPLNRADGFNSRIEVAIAPLSPTVVYANVGTNSGDFYRSTDGGIHFTQVGSGTGASWYNNTVWVSPLDPNLLVVGGGSVQRSTDGGVSFTDIGSGYILTEQPHPDNHLVLNDPGYNGGTNRRVYVTNDGGVFRTDDITAATRSSGWVSLNRMYQTTQLYGASGHPNGLLIGGTQDNGTLRVTTSSLDATLMYGGDGGYCAVDWLDGRYAYGEYIGLDPVRSTDGGLSVVGIGQNLPDRGHANFIAPFILDPNDPSRMLAGGKSLWLSTDVRTGNPVSWTAIRPAGSDSISAIAVAPGHSNVIWTSQNDGKIYKTTSGTSGSPAWTTIDDNASVNPLPNRYPTRILVDTRDSNIVYVAFGSFEKDNLWRTTDGGATWSSLSGAGATALPKAPVRGIAQHPANPLWLYVGTEVGIFTSEDGGQTWSASNDGPANVVVDEVVFVPGTTTLVAATHGRGMWTANAAAPVVTLSSVSPATGPASGGTNVTLTGAGFASGATVTFGGASATNVSVTSATAITCTTPTHAAGAVDVAVAVPARGSATLPSGFTYTSSGTGCTTGGPTLCLNANRFRLTVSWRSPYDGSSGVGTAAALTSDTGYFWFFSASNVELVIKVLDGRAANGRFWLFYAALSDVEYTLTVTDTTTGAVKTYYNPPRTLASVADTNAF